MKGLMFLFALVIGVVAYNAAQRSWMSAMQTRINDVSASQNDWLPPPQPVELHPNEDFQRMMTSSPSVIQATHR